MHCSSQALLKSAFGTALQLPQTALLPPPFLLPSFPTTHRNPFSTTPIPQKYKRVDNNPSRGVSALRRTGLGKKQRLSVLPRDLPKPVLNPDRRSKIEVDEDHGLWEFFRSDGSTMYTPIQLAAHGRAWTVQELRAKDWEDLHRLWWVCVKEKNRIATADVERGRMGEMYGKREMEGRVGEIWKTQKAIKYVLTERWYTWDNARYAAMEDEEVNLYANPEKGEPAYLPKHEESSSRPEGGGQQATAGSLPPHDNVEARPESRV